MVWTSPMTAVDNSAMTASLYNSNIRDNLRMSAPFLASGAGQIFVTTGANSLAARSIHYDEVTTSEGTTSSSYTDLATEGPSVTLGAVYGQQALVFTTCELNQSGADLQASAAVEVSGASSYPASDTRCAITRDGLPASNGVQMMGCYLYDPLSREGTITFTMKYRNGGSGTATFSKRRILVIGL